LTEIELLTMSPELRTIEPMTGGLAWKQRAWKTA